MKFRTFQELELGTYKQIPVEETKTYQIVSWYLFISMFIVLLTMGITMYVTRNLYFIFLILLLIPIYKIGYNIMRYLYLCETFIEDKPLDIDV